MWFGGLITVSYVAGGWVTTRNSTVQRQEATLSLTPLPISGRAYQPLGRNPPPLPKKKNLSEWAK